MAARTRRARVTGIGGIFFKAKDPAGMAEWYRDHLGIPVEDSVALFAWRGGKDGKAHGHTVWSIFPADTKYFGEDVDVNRDIEESKYGRFGWVRDPEGNRIELWEPPKRNRAPEKAMPME